MSFKVGSLFDGSGGFPLAAFMQGGVPVWASEIEPYPIAVTRSRFPYVKHLGSVTDVKGNEIDPADVITFGSPCQDLSVAGKRAGLKHEDNGDEETTRSGLFMEAVRIIREMREATNGKYPRFAVWENVPGAFSSNKGEDFRIVLEELIKIVEPSAVMPTVPKNGWPYADSYSGDGWSLAYRVFDAQHWGVPQRRRRIYLVLDLGGQCAEEILFKSEGLRGYFETGRTPWKGIAGNAESGSGTAIREGNCVAYSFDSLASNSMKSKNPHSGCRQVDVAKTLDCFDPNPSKNQGGIAVLEPVGIIDEIPVALEPGIAAREGGHIYEGVSGTLRANAGDNQMAVAYCYDARGNGEGGVCPTLTGDHENRVTDYTAVLVEPVVYNGENITSPLNQTNPQPGDPCHTLGTDSRNYVVCCIDGDKIGKAERSGGSGLGIRDGDKMYTLTVKDAGTHSVCYAMQGFGDYKESDVSSGLKARDYKDATDLVVEPPVVLDRAFYNQGVNAQCEPQLYTDGTCPTLVAKGPAAVCVRYIVRRLTPTECARLQGFPDDWGHPDVKTEFTDEEYDFWLNVRNTHAEINGKAVKDYTRDQMLKWYNKLHTDSSEYKLWGNGIALPNALYVMQGIADVLI